MSLRQVDFLVRPTYIGIRKKSGGTPQGGVISPVLANLFMHLVYENGALTDLYSKSSPLKGLPLMQQLKAA